MRTVARLLPSHSAPLTAALRVDRALPRRELRRVGPFVFLDHFGPVPLADDAMKVPAHPHVGLQTVTYLVSGSVRHRDSLGSDQIIKPGDVNWMTSGRGIVHSETSQASEEATLHGIQSWIALPKDARKTAPAFRHVGAEMLPVHREAGVEIRAIAGALRGTASPAPTFSPLTYLDVRLETGASTTIETDPTHALALYVVEGAARCGDVLVPTRNLAELSAAGAIALTATETTRLLVIGGVPLPDPVVTFWNFVVDSIDEGRDEERRWEEGGFPKIPD